MRKTEIPKWMKITEAKAVIEINGGNIYFTSLKDAKKVYEFAVGWYRQHNRKIDFKRPRTLKMGKDFFATFIAVEPEVSFGSGKSSPYKPLVDDAKPLVPV